MSAGQEIERKFLVDGDPPLDLHAQPCQRISQGYLAVHEDGTEVRLRTKGEKQTLGVKSGPSRTRVEEEIEIDARCFESLWPLTADRRVEKRRFLIPAGGELAIELDVYDGELTGLLTAEVEFRSESDADAFEPPSWLGAEVTGDPAYSNQSLARRGRQDRPARD